MLKILRGVYFNHFLYFVNLNFPRHNKFFYNKGEVIKNLYYFYGTIVVKFFKYMTINKL